MLDSYGLKLPMIADYIAGGSVFFVQSTHSLANNNPSYGKNPERPLATLVYALTQCTADKGDIIVLLAGHAETLTAAGMLSTAGVIVIGSGNGTNRPTITINAAIPGLNMTGANVKVYNCRVLAGSSVTAATRLIRVAASNIKFISCEVSMAYDMYHMIVVLSGDNVIFEDCVLLNTVTTSASVHPQTGVLNIGGTNVLLTGCRFNDFGAKKTERWRTCVKGGKLTASLTVEKCQFICRGVATQTRTAGASGYMATIDCRGISPSGNTAVGSIFYGKYQYLLETYNVAAVNKVGLLTVTAA